MPKIANVYQEKNGKWYFSASIGVDEITGKRNRIKRAGFATQKEAKRAYDDFMNNHSKSAIRRNSTMSFKEFFEVYYEPQYKKSVRTSTYENRVSTMQLHFQYFNGLKLLNITPIICQKWQNELASKYSSQYARSLYGMLQKCLDLAVKLGLISKNPARQIPNIKKVKKKVDFWTLEEFQQVISSFDLSDYYEQYSAMMIWFLFMTGVRFGEMQALNWKDIDFKEQTVTISKSMYYKNRDEFYITEPKTQASNRTIALDNDTISYLREWKEVQSRHVSSGYVMSYNSLPTNKHAIAHIIKKKVAITGVHRIKGHALRHSHASLLISLGENVLVIRDRLGHEDIKTTLGTYGHLYPNVNKDVANKLNGLVDTKTDTKLVSEIPKFSGNQYLKNKGE